MKYLKLFEDHSNLYTQISYDEYRKSHESLQDFSPKNRNRIVEILKEYRKTRFLEDSDKTCCINKVMDKSGIILSYNDLHDGHYNDSDIFNISILFYRKKGIIDNKHILFDVDMEITQNDDGWFYVRYSYYISDRTTPIYFYKCDQFDGLLNFICDKIERGKDIQEIPGMFFGGADSEN